MRPFVILLIKVEKVVKNISILGLDGGKYVKRVQKWVDFSLKYGMLIMCAEGAYGYTMRFFFANDEEFYHFGGVCSILLFYF